MPEYLISSIIAHNIVEEFIDYKKLSSFKQNLFIEQTKLIYLSSQEVHGILQLLGKDKETKVLLSYMEEIYGKLNNLSKNVNLSSIFNNNSMEAAKYIKITHEIIELSFLLNKENIEIIQHELKLRDKLVRDKLFWTNGISIFIFLVITFLFIYSYRLYLLKLKEHLAVKEEKEKTQNALEFKSRFLSNMSHEIRTPLNSVVGLTQVLGKTKLDKKQIDIVGKIKYSSELLLGVINDILDISKIESGKMHIEKIDFNLKKLLENIQHMFQERVDEKGISLVIDYGNVNNFNLTGDSLRISQIIVNLVSNAVKFTQVGGVTISLEDIGYEKIVFKVKDTGIGLKEEQIKTLFEEFTQADMDTSKKIWGYWTWSCN
ncbi:MAG: histidine kinase dimerization/phospho-acceptor domain-containing protein [Campylobacterota bacterium]|nr:histidine kinase dimerization/phospho-acceptor domain-containing protein [Campylobacterota bacterium]